MLIRRLGHNPVIREGTPLLGLYWLYSSIRWFIARESPFEAFQNAHRLIQLEQDLGIFHERAIQAWFIGTSKGLVHLANAFYTVAYFPVVILCTILLYRNAPHRFQVFRLTFLLGLGFALICFSLFPLAPPRMLPEYGFLDTQQVFSDGFYNRKLILSFYNPHAAMPSLHFGLALLVGIIAWSSKQKILRLLGVLYPTIMALVIIITGHHYLMDIAGGAIVIGLAYSIVVAMPRIFGEPASSPVVIHRDLSMPREKQHLRRHPGRPSELRAVPWTHQQVRRAHLHKDRVTNMAMVISRGPPL